MTWVPYVIVHFLSFAVQLDLSENGTFRTFMLSLVALTSLFNTLTRVFCDPSLKQKLAFWRRNKNHNGSMISDNSHYEQKALSEQLLDQKEIGDRSSKQ